MTLASTKERAPQPSKATGAQGEQLSFLPPAPFSPIWPTVGTLADNALHCFLAGFTLEHPDFEERTGSWRLGAVVFQLRTLGWPIETLDIAAPTAECPGRRIARYFLPPRFVAEALATREARQ